MDLRRGGLPWAGLPRREQASCGLCRLAYPPTRQAPCSAPVPGSTLKANALPSAPAPLPLPSLQSISTTFATRRPRSAPSPATTRPSPTSASAAPESCSPPPPTPPCASGRCLLALGGRCRRRRAWGHARRARQGWRAWEGGWRSTPSGSMRATPMRRTSWGWQVSTVLPAEQSGCYPAPRPRGTAGGREARDACPGAHPAPGSGVARCPQGPIRCQGCGRLAERPWRRLLLAPTCCALAPPTPWPRPPCS